MTRLKIAEPGNLTPNLIAGGEAHDLVLSSGFLAFAGHSGFLQAIEDAGVKVSGVMGTSAGALAGSLYCAGYTPRQVRTQPLKPYLSFWPEIAFTHTLQIGNLNPSSCFLCGFLVSWGWLMT